MANIHAYIVYASTFQLILSHQVYFVIEQEEYHNSLVKSTSLKEKYAFCLFQNFGCIWINFYDICIGIWVSPLICMLLRIQSTLLDSEPFDFVYADPKLIVK